MKNFTHSFRLLTLLAALFVMSASAMAQTVLFTETFAGFAKGQANAGAGTADVASNLDVLTTLPGWTGAKVYEAGGSAKMGSSSVLGWIQTPAIDLSASGGNGVIKFEAMAWKGDATEMKVTVNGVAYTVTGLPNTEAYEFSPFEIPVTGLNASTSIKFEGKQGAKGRFFIKNLVIEKAAATNTPNATIAGNSYFGNIEKGASASQTYVVKGAHLTGDLTVTIAGTGYSAVKKTLSKAEVESGAGCEVKVDLLASVVGNQEGTMTISGGGLTESKVMNMVATVFEIEKIATLAELLAKDKGEAVYELSGEVLVHFVNGANIYLHDATAQTLLYNGGSIIEDALVASGHKVKGLKIKVDEYYKVKQLVPVALGTVVSTGNVLPEAVVTTVEELVANPMSFAHKFVIVHNVSMQQKPFSPTDLNNTVTGEGGQATLTCHDKYKVLDGLTPSAGKLSVTGIVSIFKDNAQIQPRSKDDIFTTVSKPTLDATNTKVYATVGKVIVETDSAARVEIFNTVGQAVKVVTVDGSATINLNKGLYIVRVNGKAVKVLVR